MGTMNEATPRIYTISPIRNKPFIENLQGEIERDSTLTRAGDTSAGLRCKQSWLRLL
jgi:hypothetical protein